MYHYNDFRTSLLPNDDDQNVVIVAPVGYYGGDTSTFMGETVSVIHISARAFQRMLDGTSFDGLLPAEYEELLYHGENLPNAAQGGFLEPEDTP